MGEKSPETFCGEFKVNDVPVKIKIEFKSESTADIFGSVYGFDMYCLKAPYQMCSDGTIDLDPNGEKEKNCLRKQFEGVDEHMSSLEVLYKEDSKKVQLKSSAMPHTFLENADKCSTDHFKFTVMDEEGNTIKGRRLSVKDILALKRAP